MVFGGNLWFLVNIDGSWRFLVVLDGFKWFEVILVVIGSSQYFLVFFMLLGGSLFFF